jgi:hypothetical protein
MKPELMEALQMLKFMLKKKWLNFTEGLQTQLEELIDNQGDTRAGNTLHSLLHAETPELEHILDSALINDD